MHWQAFLLACVPLAFVAALLAVPKPSVLAANIVQAGVAVLVVWWWIWTPFYLVLKLAFCWRAYRKEKEATKRLAKWIVATDVASFSAFLCSFVLKA